MPTLFPACHFPCRYLHKGPLHPALDSHTSHTMASLAQDMGPSWASGLVIAIMDARLQALVRGFVFEWLCLGYNVT